MGQDSEDHLRRVLLEYVNYYNHRRPHQGIGQGSQFHRRLGPLSHLWDVLSALGAGMCWEALSKTIIRSIAMRHIRFAEHG